jgi:hypothetical protein
LAVLVTVFGTASRSASREATANAARSFVHGADVAFYTAAAMMALTVAMVASMRRTRVEPGH